MPGATLRAIELAKAAGVPVVLTLGTRFVIEERPEFWQRFIADHVSVLAMNEDEAAALTGHDDPLAASFVSLYHTFANDHQALGMALAGLEARGPRLNVLYLGGPDPVSHKFWRYYEPGHAYYEADPPGPLEVAAAGGASRSLQLRVPKFGAETIGLTAPETIIWNGASVMTSIVARPGWRRRASSLGTGR